MVGNFSNISNIVINVEISQSKLDPVKIETKACNQSISKTVFD